MGTRTARDEIPSVPLPSAPARADLAAASAREVAVVLGTRSEAVALAPVVRALRRCGHLTPIVITTGQQRGALDQVLRPLGVRPDVDLAVSQTPPDRSLDSSLDSRERRLAAEEVERLGDLLVARRPDALLVHGDSTTAFAAALAASSEGIGVGHLGAGLRPGPKGLGFAEANRRLIATLTRWHLAPTPTAAANLIDEGIDAAAITVTGRTGVEALLWAASLQRGTSAFDRPSGSARVESVRPRVLACLHARDADGSGLVSLVAALGGLAVDGADVVLPLHPDTSPELLNTMILADGVRVVPPLDYLDFVATMREATLIVTDSDAIAEESPSLGVPVVVVRGAARPPERVVDLCRQLLAAASAAPYAVREPFVEGALAHRSDGRAADRVVEVLTRSLLGCGRASRSAPVRRGSRSGPPRTRDSASGLVRAPLPV